jgi:hypothetical protein
MNQEEDVRDDSIEETLRCHAPRPPETDLRAHILAAVSIELASERPARWRATLPGWAVAASIALGVVLNCWVMRDERTRDVRLLGSQPPSRRVVEIADAVRSITDPQTAALVEEWLQAVDREQVRKARSANVWPLLSTQVNYGG